MNAGPADYAQLTKKLASRRYGFCELPRFTDFPAPHHPPWCSLSRPWLHPAHSPSRWGVVQSNPRPLPLSALSLSRSFSPVLFCTPWGVVSLPAVAWIVDSVCVRKKRFVLTQQKPGKSESIPAWFVCLTIITLSVLHALFCGAIISSLRCGQMFFVLVFFFLEVLKVIAETTVEHCINILITFKTRSLNRPIFRYQPCFVVCLFFKFCQSDVKVSYQEGGGEEDKILYLRG